MGSGKWRVEESDPLGCRSHDLFSDRPTKALDVFHPVRVLARTSPLKSHMLMVSRKGAKTQRDQRVDGDTCSLRLCVGTLTIGGGAELTLQPGTGLAEQILRAFVEVEGFAITDDREQIADLL